MPVTYGVVKTIPALPSTSTAAVMDLWIFRSRKFSPKFSQNPRSKQNFSFGFVRGWRFGAIKLVPGRGLTKTGGICLVVNGILFSRK